MGGLVWSVWSASPEAAFVKDGHGREEKTSCPQRHYLSPLYSSLLLYQEPAA